MKTLIEVVNQEWRDQAACARPDIPTESFYPVKGKDGNEAKAICEACPVRSECLEYAITNNEAIGVWGGASRTERRRIVRERAKAAPRAQEQVAQ